MNRLHTQCERCNKPLDPTIPIESGILCQWCYVLEEEFDEFEIPDNYEVTR